MDLELYLCRHGETEWSLSGQHTGATDLPLTQQGRKQALSLSRRLHKISFPLIFSSPLERAVETCELAGFKPTLDPDLVEWNYGAYEGKTHLEISRQNPNWDLFRQGALGGESPSDVAQRADRFLERIKNEKGPILIFSHGHFLRMLAARWLQLNPEQARSFFLTVASISILGFEHQKPVLKLWNETL